MLEINQKKILETKNILIEVIKNPASFKDDSELKTSLKSQGALAKYSNSDRGISPCSLNTLKNAAESLLTRGFVELDELRISAKDSLEKECLGAKATTKTRTGLKHKVDELQHQIGVMQKSNFLLSVIIEELRSELKQLAYSELSPEQAQSAYTEYNKRLEAKLSYINSGDV